MITLKSELAAKRLAKLPSSAERDSALTAGRVATPTAAHTPLRSRQRWSRRDTIAA